MSKILRSPRLGALVGLVAAAALLSGCAQGASTSPSPTPSASAPMTSPPVTGTPPTAEQMAWAGQVCTSTETLKTDIQGLVTAATSGNGDVQAALKSQMTKIKDSADSLAKTVESLPAGSENDPERAAVTKAASNFDASIANLDASVNAVVATTGADRVAALKAMSKAASESLVALGSMVQAITTAAADGASTLGQAFDGAPECSGATK